MSKAINIFMTDTETASEIMKALVYDFGGGKTTLRNGGLSDTMNYINYNVFYEKQDMMASAYYANKLPAYRDEIWKGKREVFDIMEIRERVHKYFKENNITVVCAHNARFDIRALNNSVREATNGRVKYFFPYGIEIWDTLKMARQVLGNMPTYKKFCEDNGYMTNHAKPRPRYTAEIIYRFITKNLEFEEAHTGLKDVEIETEILAYLVKQHKKMDKVLYHAPNKA